MNTHRGSGLDQRLHAWWEEFEEKLRSKWWLWPIAFAIDLAWHWTAATVVEFLVSSRSAIFQVLGRSLEQLGSMPVIVAAVLSLAILVGLLVYAFVESSPKAAVAEPGAEIALLDVIFERSTSSSIVYKSKVRLVFSNDTGRDVDVLRTEWETEQGDVQVQPPLRYTFQLEGSGGWVADQWQGEQTSIRVGAGKAFRTWLGLDPALTTDELRRRHKVDRLGIVVLPLLIDGKRVDYRIRI